MTTADNFTKSKRRSKVNHVQNLEFGATCINNFKHVNAKAAVEGVVVWQGSFVCVGFLWDVSSQAVHL